MADPADTSPLTWSSSSSSSTSSSTSRTTANSLAANPSSTAGTAISSANTNQQSSPSIEPADTSSLGDCDDTTMATTVATVATDDVQPTPDEEEGTGGSGGVGGGGSEVDVQSESGVSTDFLFEPSVEMMVNDFDDEQTLEEEERLAAAESQDPGAELSSLQREQDMPIEELLALYNCHNRQAPAPSGAAAIRRQKKREIAERKALLAGQQKQLYEQLQAATAAMATLPSIGSATTTQSSSVRYELPPREEDVPAALVGSTRKRRRSSVNYGPVMSVSTGGPKRTAATKAAVEEDDDDDEDMDEAIRLPDDDDDDDDDEEEVDDEDEDDEVEDEEEEEQDPRLERKVRPVAVATLLSRRAAVSSSPDQDDDEDEEDDDESDDDDGVGGGTTKGEGPSQLHKLYPETFAGVDPRQLMPRLQHSGDEDDEEEDDGDYSPEEDDFKKTIMVGSEFQAVIPEGLCRYGDALPYENEDKLVWDPFKLPETDVVRYEHKSGQLRAQNIAAATAAMEPGGAPHSNTGGKATKSPVGRLLAQLPVGGHLRDDEHSLYLLLQCGHNVDEALRRRRIGQQSAGAAGGQPVMSEWSEEECRNFESGLRIYGKDFHTIQLQKVRTRAVGELVQFYYVWKKTQRHDVFANKARMDKKKYNLHPGLTDYMDRFLEEQECIGGGGTVPATTAGGGAGPMDGGSSMSGGQHGMRDRSVSPGVNSLMYNNYRRYRLGDGMEGADGSKASGGRGSRDGSNSDTAKP